ncbi:MAG: glycosyltransferase family 32 protein [Stellaceae bacterium]
MSADIPKILHQTWRSADLPPRFARWRQSWLDLHPHWEQRFYDDAAIYRVVADRAPDLLPVFEALERPIARVDLFRYVIVHLDGGLYADMDMEPYRASDPLLDGSGCVLSIEARIGRRYQTLLGYSQPWQIANCIFAAAPGHPFLAALIERIAQTATAPVRRDADVEDMTGPRMLTRLLYGLPAARRGVLCVLPQIHWMAPWEYPRVGPLARLIYARHATSGTWRDAAAAPLSWRDRLIARNRLPNPFSNDGPELA